LKIFFNSIYLQWLETVVMGWLHRVYGDFSDDEDVLELEVSKKKLLHFLYETYTKTRVDEFFNIIIG